MANARTLGSHVTMAYRRLNAARLLGMENSETPLMLFYAAENLVMATLESENIPRSQWKSIAGNHQLGRMIDCLPDESGVKHRLKPISELTAFATTYRYPTEAGRLPPPVNREKIEEHYHSLANLLQEFATHFKVRVMADDPVALNDKPIRGAFDHENIPGGPQMA